MEVREVEVISRSVKYEGTYNAKYTITGNAGIYGGKVQNIDNGEVRTPDGMTMLATFSQYSEGNSNISFQNVTTTAQKQEIMAAVDEFMAAVGNA